MKSLSTRRAKRSTALLALLVWLFALASGMAHACLLVAPGYHSHVAAHQAPAAPHAHAADVLADHAGTVDGHDDDWDGTKPSCLKACEDGSNAPVKLKTSAALTDPGMATLAVLAWTVAQAIVSAPGRFDDLQVHIVGPPFRVRYSRLTL